MSSQEHLNIVKFNLEKLSSELDYMYDELHKEIYNEKKIKHDKDNEDYRRIALLYDELDYKIVEKMIKSRLPWRVKLLNKVYFRSYGITDDNEIFIDFVFNNNFRDLLTMTFSRIEVTTLLTKFTKFQPNQGDQHEEE